VRGRRALGRRFVLSHGTCFTAAVWGVLGTGTVIRRRRRGRLGLVR
jgi:hypothetical protein